MQSFVLLISVVAIFKVSLTLAVVSASWGHECESVASLLKLDANWHNVSQREEGRSCESTLGGGRRANLQTFLHNFGSLPRDHGRIVLLSWC